MGDVAAQAIEISVCASGGAKANEVDHITVSLRQMEHLPQTERVRRRLSGGQGPFRVLDGLHHMHHLAISSGRYSKCMVS